MSVDVTTSDGDKLLESAKEAYAIIGKVSDTASCSGDCRTLFRAQLIALYMNVLKFSGMGDSIFAYAGNAYDGQTVSQILAAGISLLTDGSNHDFTSFQTTLDLINNNGHDADGSHVLVCAHA